MRGVLFAAAGPASEHVAVGADGIDGAGRRHPVAGHQRAVGIESEGIEFAQRDISIGGIERRSVPARRVRAVAADVDKARRDAFGAQRPTGGPERSHIRARFSTLAFDADEREDAGAQRIGEMAIVRRTAGCARFDPAHRHLRQHGTGRRSGREAS